MATQSVKSNAVCQLSFPSFLLQVLCGSLVVPGMGVLGNRTGKRTTRSSLRFRMHWIQILPDIWGFLLRILPDIRPFWIYGTVSG